LARKAFRFGGRDIHLPFPLLHIDTGHNYSEVIEFRDQIVQQTGAELIVEYVEDSITRGSVKLRKSTDSRNAAQATTLLEAIEKHQFDALMGGARRDEEKARAKERFFSHRDEFGQWAPKNQRPELWNLFNGRKQVGEHFRVFPISNWSELDVWHYIRREGIALPPLYFAHERHCIRYEGRLIAASPYLNTDEQDEFVTTTVRYRTVGDMTCTAAVESDADQIDDIIEEIKFSKISERGARMDDKVSEAAMEDRKKGGYF
jgi:sulfate adenylyltransferase subunit 2